MRIQVHDDGVVEFSVKLGANVDANNLAALVNAVRSSNAKNNNNNSYSNSANSSPRAALPPPMPKTSKHFVPQPAFDDSSVSSPDMKTLLRPSRSPPSSKRYNSNTASMPRTFHLPPHPVLPPRSKTPPHISPQSPRLPDRSKLHDNMFIQHDTHRSISQPDLGRKNPSNVVGVVEPFPVRHASNNSYLTDESGDTLMQDLKDNKASLATINTNESESIIDEDEEELNGHWQEVEYELTPAYRSSDITGAERAKHSYIRDRVAGRRSFNPAQENLGIQKDEKEKTKETTKFVYGKKKRALYEIKNRWNILSRLRNKRQESRRSKHTPTISPITSTKSSSIQDSNNDISENQNDSIEKLGGFLLDGIAIPTDEWLEFSTIMSRDEALSEVTKFAKLRGNQVWKRPGEHKIRCIRRLSRNNEMHMVIVVEAHPTTGGTLVRVRRAKSDRGKTEWWRYLHFYRDVMARLSAAGHSVIPLQLHAAHGTATQASTTLPAVGSGLRAEDNIIPTPTPLPV